MNFDVNFDGNFNGNFYGNFYGNYILKQDKAIIERENTNFNTLKIVTWFGGESNRQPDRVPAKSLFSVCSNLYILFKALALWAHAFYKSIRPYVCVFVCLCISSLLRYRLTVFLPPLQEVGCPNFLEIWTSLGKVMERSGLRFENFCS